jgi:hypothetical protein
MVYVSTIHKRKAPGIQQPYYANTERSRQEPCQSDMSYVSTATFVSCSQWRPVGQIHIYYPSEPHSVY